MDAMILILILMLMLIQMAATVACPYPRKNHPTAAHMPQTREAEGHARHLASESGVPP